MNFRSKESQQQLELNLTPLIDVVFLLLIFFMVSTTFDKQSQLKIQLPEAVTNHQSNEKDKKLVITIGAQGEYFINDKNILNQSYKTLKIALEKAAKDDKDLPVIIRADAKAPYQSVVRVMDVASQLGLNRLVFPAKRPQDIENY